MKKLQVRKVGPVRLTSAVSAAYALICGGP